MDNDDFWTKSITIFIIELGIWVILACANFGCNWGTFFGGGRLLWIMMIFEPNLLQFSSLGLVYGSYEQVAMVQCHVFLTAVGYHIKFTAFKRWDLYVSRIMWILCSTQPVNGHQRLHSPFLWPDIWVKSESNCICLRQIWVKIPKSAYSLTEGIGLSSPFLLLLANYSDIWQMSVI